MRQPESRFTSERFSGAGERFLYVKADGEGRDDEARLRLRDAIEDCLAALLPSMSGAIVGASLGDRFAYLDLAVREVDAAWPRVRAALQDAKLGARAWIQFHDADWSAQWIAVHPDHAPPPMSDP